VTGGGTGPGAGRRCHDRWTASGLRALTGRPDGPGLDPPPGLVTGLDALAAAIAGSSGRLGRPVVVDPLDVLAGRGRASGLRRRGDVSCGGSARLVRAADGWLVVNLARPADRELVPAWLDLPPGREGWGPVLAAVGERTVAGAVDDAAGLGLPVAVVGERAPSDGGVAGSVPGVRVGRSTAGPPRPLADLVVVDLSALWAGPLVASLLGRGGARVVKVESADRPDGARRGDAAHYRWLNGGKASVVLDLSSAAGRRRLTGLVDRADVVVTASRPRALEQLGLDPGSGRPDGGPGCSCRSPATAPRPGRPTGWPSATTRRPPGDWWCGTGTARASAPMRSPTRPPDWLPPPPSWPSSNGAATPGSRRPWRTWPPG